jgi:hypothetical protein
MPPDWPPARPALRRPALALRRPAPALRQPALALRQPARPALHRPARASPEHDRGSRRA